jgi:hypothetical protein
MTKNLWIRRETIRHQIPHCTRRPLVIVGGVSDPDIQAYVNVF